MKLSIIIPVYNEINTIDILLKRVLNTDLDNIEKEIIIIESGSTDGTHEYVKQLKNPKIKTIFEDKPIGKGHALKAGFRVATGDIILIQDADLEYDPKDYLELLQPILENKTHFVLGSRYLGKNTWKIRILNKSVWYANLLNIGSLFINWLLYKLYHIKLTDPLTMFKVFKRKCIRGIKFIADSFSLDMEIVIRLIKQGFLPLEVPVSYNARTTEEGKKIKVFRDGFLMLATIIKHKFVR
ncbi:MAG: glycosyltransferase family 2 protein [Promethearchaeota archaeon]